MNIQSDQEIQLRKQIAQFASMQLHPDINNIQPFDEIAQNEQSLPTDLQTYYTQTLHTIENQ